MAKVVDLFVGAGRIVAVLERGQIVQPREATGRGAFAQLPVVVLQDDGSASATEMLAGAFQRLGRALTIGQKSFGKGSVQVIYDIKDKAALKITVAEYVLADGAAFDGLGISADVRLREMAKVKPPAEDPVVQLAARIVQRAKAPSRSQMLEAVQGVKEPLIEHVRRPE